MTALDREACGDGHLPLTMLDRRLTGRFSDR